jgi:hypothetical protein
LGQSLFRFAGRKKGKNRLERSPAPKRSPIALVISREKMDRRANGEPNSVQPKPDEPDFTVGSKPFEFNIKISNNPRNYRTVGSISGLSTKGALKLLRFHTGMGIT